MMHRVEDHLEEDENGPEERWYVYFLRALAVLYLIWGVANWASILGVPGTANFPAETIQRQILIGYLAVMMPIAAVGLWIGASWGTVIWLVVALSEVIANTLFADLFGWAFDLVIFHIVTMVAYLALAWLVARKRPA